MIEDVPGEPPRRFVVRVAQPIDRSSRRSFTAVRGAARIAMVRSSILFLCLQCLACSQSPTQIFLVVHIDAGRALDQIQIAVRSQARTFPKVLRPEVTAAPLVEPQSLAILLPDDSSGQEHTITVEGLWRGAVVISAATVVKPVEGQSLAAEVWLGERPSDAGSDGRRGDGPLDLSGGKDLGDKDSGPDAVQCKDADKDGVTVCAGDCDDADPNAYPGQTGFFSSATKGKGNFDYNCDKVEEKEVGQLVSCERIGSDCQGHGWQGSVPACGVLGVFITCKPSGQTSCSHDQTQKVQGCR